MIDQSPIIRNHYCSHEMQQRRLPGLISLRQFIHHHPLLPIRIAISSAFHTSTPPFATEVPNQPPQTKLAETRLRRFWRLVSVDKHQGLLPPLPSISNTTH